MHFIFSILKNFFKSTLWNQAGFSLLEMSIVLIIVGTLASVILPALLTQNVVAKRTLTRQHQQAIFYSLAAYLLAGHSLPCPADPSAIGAQFGVEREGGCSNPIHAVGILPFRTLGLPESVARDGYQHFFTYAVMPRLTLELDDFNGGQFNDKFRDSYCKIRGQNVATSHVLQVKNAKGHSVLEEETKTYIDQNADFIAVVIVSHGEAGHGAFCADGSNARFKSENFGQAEEQNARDDLLFIDQPYSSNSKHLFRHIVAWVTHKNLVAIYGHTPCKLVPQRDELSLALQPEISLEEKEVDLDLGL
jgi:prepilin-type N-terminal cleavage/methylation domain-containing protein